MREFKVGETVRVRRSSPSATRGMVGEVVEVKPGSDRALRVSVKFATEREVWVYAPEELAEQSEFRVYMRTAKQAEEDDRRIHGVADNVRLGWTPYRILVTAGGGSLSLAAFYTARAFRAWLNAHGLSVHISPHWSPNKGHRWGVMYREEAGNA